MYSVSTVFRLIQYIWHRIHVLYTVSVEKLWTQHTRIIYCISRKTVDTEYTYYILYQSKNCGHRIHVLYTVSVDVYWYCQMKKNEWLWKFWKRNDLYENFEKGGRRKRNPCPMRLWIQWFPFLICQSRKQKIKA